MRLPVSCEVGKIVTKIIVIRKRTIRFLSTFDISYYVLSNESKPEGSFVLVIFCCLSLSDRKQNTEG
jgi:hypothetical protein